MCYPLENHRMDVLKNKNDVEMNQKGFSLVELIIVIAIIAALMGTVVFSVSMVFSANAKACANNLQRAIADCKVTTMGKTEAYLLIYRGNDKRIYSQMYIGEFEQDEENGGFKKVDKPVYEEPQKIGGNRVRITYVDEDGNVHEDEDFPIGTDGGDVGLKIEFDRSSGSLKEGAPQSIDIIGGNRHYRLTFNKLTGKVSTKQV